MSEKNQTQIGIANDYKILILKKFAESVSKYPLDKTMIPNAVLHGLLQDSIDRAMSLAPKPNEYLETEQIVDDLNAEIEAQKKEIKELKEALRWYAHGMPWRDDVGAPADLAKKVLNEEREII